MSLFQWKNEYSVGHVHIDAQHKRLFELAGELHSAMLAGKGNEVLSATLADLIAYTKRHFAAEENLMVKFGYPDTPRHKTEHTKLTADVMEFQKKFEARKSTVTLGLLQFLKNWLTHHIGESDRKIAAYLREKAV